MNTKICSNCGLEVPSVAKRCKSCFHDFDSEKPKSYLGILGLLGTLAAMSLVGATTLYMITIVPLEERALIDQETQSVVWTRQYRSGITTERLAWSDVSQLEYIIHKNGDYELAAVTLSGDRKTVLKKRTPLRAEANEYSQVMSKPLKEVEKAGGFGGDLK